MATGCERDDAAAARDGDGERRDQNAFRRDRTSSGRDELARARDAAALDRDAEAARRETADGRRDFVAEAAAARLSAASDRDDAAGDRLAGALDRGSAGTDRDTARSDRGSASSDRDAAARDLHHASLDGLTGAYTRAAGFLELQREIDRARRTREPLVLAFLDLVGLKGINDEGGHAAGDAVLVRVVRAVRTQLRPYDLVVRYGGDEFVCVLANTDADAGSAWQERLQTALVPDKVTVGLAHLHETDDVHTLLQRADADMYQQR
jgi:diguanylate cyclase (GGDEF)-like protein